MKTKILVPTLAFAVLILAIVVPNLVSIYLRRNDTASNACVSNLRMIQAAKEQWALETHKTANDMVTMEDIQPYMGRGSAGELPICPSGGIYTPQRVGQPPTCSIGGQGHSLRAP